MIKVTRSGRKGHGEIPETARTTGIQGAYELIVEEVRQGAQISSVSIFTMTLTRDLSGDIGSYVDTAISGPQKDMLQLFSLLSECADLQTDPMLSVLQIASEP